MGPKRRLNETEEGSSYDQEHKKSKDSENIELLLDDMDEIKNKLNRLDDIAKLLTIHDKRITELETEVNHLKEANSNMLKQIREQESLLASNAINTNRINLIYSGITDAPNENDMELRGKVFENTGNKENIDVLYRLGKYKDGSCRPVKVRFVTMSERNLAWAKKKTLKHPIYAAEDLPKSVRVKRALDRQNRKRETNEHSVASTMEVEDRLTQSKPSRPVTRKNN